MLRAAIAAHAEQRFAATRDLSKGTTQRTFHSLPKTIRVMVLQLADLAELRQRRVGTSPLRGRA
jgi:hypothetical protein